MKQWHKVLAGSIATYLLVAACAAETHSDNFKATVDAGLDAMGLDAVADALGIEGDGGGGITNPVPEAAAKSGSRLKAYKDVGADGSEAYTGTFRDTQRNEDCSPSLATDGSRRCMPVAYAAATAYFSDSACSTPLIIPAFAGVTFNPGEAASIYRPAVKDVGIGISNPREAFTVGSVYSTGGIFILLANGSCSVGARNPDTTYYSRGAAVPPSAFVSLSRTTD